MGWWEFKVGKGLGREGFEGDERERRVEMDLKGVVVVAAMEVERRRGDEDGEKRLKEGEVREVGKREEEERNGFLWETCKEGFGD